MIRILYCLILLIGIQQVSATNIQAVDSVKQILKNDADPRHRVDLYRNLADICCDTPDEKVYLWSMYQEAEKGNDREAMTEALSSLIFAEAKVLQLDSAYHYLKLMKKIAVKEDKESLLPYFRMRFFDLLCYQGKQAEAVEGELAFEKKETDKSVYDEIAEAYITGSGFFMSKHYQKAIPYFEIAYQKSTGLPQKIRYRYMSFTSWNLAFAYCLVGENPKAVVMIEQIIDMMQQHYKSNWETSRPFYNISEHLFQYYAFMISNVAYLTPQQEAFYWEIINRMGKAMTTSLDIYNYYLAMNNYYMESPTHADPRKALQANDSLIKYAPIVAANKLAGLYGISANLYEKMGDYAHALEYYKKSSTLQDSLTSRGLQEQLNELQVKYDLNKLNNEKSQLEIKNKRIWLICLSLILGISCMLCIYLYRSLKKEKAMKIRLRILNSKVEESEKIKHAFINSVCHEIRTPLNAIVGFSDLIIDESIDNEIRSTFPQEIQQNTALLTSLIDSMLEVANLDVSTDRLPCKPADITGICRLELERVRSQAKEGIEYRLEVSDEVIIAPTHEKYLGMVIKNLLDNANKFTEHGSITLLCTMDKPGNYLYISVTDTGCGIPKDKQKEVFQRFAKLDSFVPGGGLGLYLCQLIVSRLAGKIWVDPDYTDGARFIVHLPLCPNND
ncbi:sensor histidine kinase [Phocaeicola sp.]